MKKSREHDLIRLKHMRDAAQEALSFTQDISRPDLDENKMTQFAVLHAMQIVGEAASQITDECQAENPQIPWGAIIGMRNILVHAYFQINLDIVWVTIQDHLPSMIEALEILITQMENEQGN